VEKKENRKKKINEGRYIKEGKRFFEFLSFDLSTKESFVKTLIIFLFVISISFLSLFWEKNK
jgi:hypothetical protein